MATEKMPRKNRAVERFRMRLPGGNRVLETSDPGRRAVVASSLDNFIIRTGLVTGPLHAVPADAEHPRAMDYRMLQS
jgi:hypothetical protein